MDVGRRSFLTGAAATGATLSLTGWSWRPSQTPLPADLPDGLFALGIASGDPRPAQVVLWTRLAPDPLNGGGMPNRPIRIAWEVAADENMKKIVRSGKWTARPENAHAVRREHDHAEPQPRDE